MGGTEHDIGFNIIRGEGMNDIRRHGTAENPAGMRHDPADRGFDGGCGVANVGFDLGPTLSLGSGIEAAGDGRLANVHGHPSR